MAFQFAERVRLNARKVVFTGVVIDGSGQSRKVRFARPRKRRAKARR